MNWIKNKIIVEGFWNMGKTSLIKEMSKEFGYKIIYEPNHLEKNVTSDLKKWYIKEHQKKMEKFFSVTKQKVIIERSILSSAAFLYATDKFSSKDKKILLDFVNSYNRFKPLVVFLYAGDSKIQIASKLVKDANVRKFLAKKNFRKKYDFFFRNVLPFEFGIAPIFINIEKDKNAKSIKNLKQCVEKVMKEDRIAQVNLICYKIKNTIPYFLLLKRNPQKGNFWQGITGGVKIGEIIHKTLKRELFEEISIKSKKKFLSTNYSFNYIGGEDYELNEYVFGYELKSKDNIVLSKEHVEYKFASIKESISMLKYESNKASFQKVYFFIKKRR